MNSNHFDVVVVGAGNAALCSALSASDSGAQVLVLEKAPESESGGNSHYVGGLMRFPHEGTADLLEMLEELRGPLADTLEVAPYREADFFNEIAVMGQYRSDPELVDVLVSQARDAVKWVHSKGVRFNWSVGRHAHKVKGRFRFFGGAGLEVSGAGAGLLERLNKAVASAGISIRYGTQALDLLGTYNNVVTGVRVREDSGRIYEISAGAVVLACGGFEANTEMRARYLGPNWDLAKVRGTKHNTGDGINMALRFGATPYGHWSGCHATPWDANAPATGDRSVGDQFSRHSYPLGIVVNQECRRFMDEGANFHTHTYAKYGREILAQPGIIAYQIFDQKVVGYLRSDYRAKQVSKSVGDTIEELAKGLELNPERLAETVREFNNAVDEVKEFDPNVLDGKATRHLSQVKSNWAQKLDSPPYVGFPVSTGITFTFGGLRINPQAQVLDGSGAVINGLYAAGELVGGLFYHNYPSGSGLSSGAVFGRAAGAGAAEFARAQAAVTMVSK